jgi:tetratricopeptide (TPR) repeat protein
VGVLLALSVAACGSSTPRQATVSEPTAVIAAASPEAAQPQRRDRSRERRADSDEGAATDAAAPVPEAALALYGRALTAMRADNWLDAELELEQLTAEHPAYPGPHVNLAIVYAHDGRRAAAHTALERALAIDPEHAAANNQLGILLREEGQFEEAERAYRRALDSDPSYDLAHYNLAVLLDVYLRRTAEALAHYEIYQDSLAEPDQTIGRWIIDLRRRVGDGADRAHVAKEDGP